MSRSERERRQLLDQRRLIARFPEDLREFRAAGSDEIARYYERLLAMIEDGTFYRVPTGAGREETVRVPPGTKTDERYRAGRQWFETMLGRAVARGPADHGPQRPPGPLPANGPLDRDGMQ